MRVESIVKGVTVCGMAALVVCTQAACGKKISEKIAEKVAEKVAEKAMEHDGGGKADVDISKGTVKIKTKDGEATFSGGDASAVPSDFPSDVPIHKGSTVLSSMLSNDGTMVMLETADNAEKVMAGYKEKLLGDGWKQESAVDLGGGKILTVEKDGRKATISVSGEGSATHIMLMANAPEGAK
jgi:hypothetical protein